MRQPVRIGCHMLAVPIDHGCRRPTEHQTGAGLDRRVDLLANHELSFRIAPLPPAAIFISRGPMTPLDSMASIAVVNQGKNMCCLIGSGMLHCTNAGG